MSPRPEEPESKHLDADGPDHEPTRTADTPAAGSTGHGDAAGKGIGSTASTAATPRADRSSLPATTAGPAADQTPDEDDLMSFTVVTPESAVEQSIGKGTTIAGRYRLVEPIGSGGMGAVWLARQQEPVQREVAIKLVKSGFGSRQAVARFQLERQSLALMEHPNIAVIHDGGVLSDGSPWFAMELVRGNSITRYADQNRLGIEARLELFLEVCRGLHHAHQKGIIHRDIKPSNILVALHNGKPVPKLIDFGVAKSLQNQWTGDSVDTGVGIVGTPHYMSPEQATFGCEDIDIRSDVYSLGVLLYELLTGSTPFRSETRPVDLTELLRQIREADPVRPSTRVRQTETPDSVSLNRRSEPQRLASLLQKELDWVVIKALEKDRERRYASAWEFSLDIQRFLAGEAVLAHPPSRRYRLGKFVSRHRGAAIATGLLTLAVAGGTVGTTLGMFAAREQARIAKRETTTKDLALRESEEQRILADKAKLEAEAATEESKRRTAELERVAQFQSDQLSNLDPRSLGTLLRNAIRTRYLDELERLPLTAAERKLQQEQFEAGLRGVNFTDVAILGLESGVLDRAVEEMEQQLADQPAILARLLFSTAMSFESLGLYERAIGAHRRAHALRREHLGEAAPDTLLSLEALGYACQSALDLTQAERLYREVLRLCEEKGVQSPQSIAATQANLASVLFSQGKTEEGQQWFDRSLISGGLLEDELVREKRAAIELNNQATILLDQGNLVEAEEIFREAVGRLSQLFGKNHPMTSISMANLASALDRQEKLEEALEFREQALDNMRRERGDAHPTTLDMANNCGVLLWRMGRFDDAIAVFEKLEDNAEGVWDESHPQRMEALANLTVNYREAKRYDRCIVLLQDLLRRKITPEFRERLRTDLFETLTLAGKEAALGQWMDEELAGLRAASDTDPLFLASRLAFFSMAWFRVGQWQRAEPMLEEAFEIRKRLVPGTWSAAVVTSMMGELRYRTGRADEAESLLLEGAEAVLAADFPPAMVEEGQADDRRREACRRLVDFYQAQGQPEKATVWQKRLDGL